MSASTPTQAGRLRKPLSPATDNDELFERWQCDRDESAREELVRRFLPLARRLARRYMGAREPLDDLVQVASVALVKAIDRFDYKRGVAFSSYAIPTMAGELKRYFRDLGWSVHVPRGTQELALQVKEGEQRLTAELGRSPTVNELTVYLELSFEEVVDGLEAATAHHSKSLDAPQEDGDGDPGTVGDTIGSVDKGYEFVDMRASIATAAAGLSERDRQVLALRFIDDLTQTEIAGRLGVSQMQVSRILSRSVSHLEAALGETAQANAR
jgi:RNA polymerase sigma-B factor